MVHISTFQEIDCERIGKVLYPYMDNKKKKVLFEILAIRQVIHKSSFRNVLYFFPKINLKWL